MVFVCDVPSNNDGEHTYRAWPNDLTTMHKYHINARYMNYFLADDLSNYEL